MNAREKFSTSSSTALISRLSIEEIVESRDKALELYKEAWRLLSAANDAVKAAHEMARRAAPLHKNSYNYDRADEIDRFHNAIKLPDGDEYLRVATKLTDIGCWAHIVSVTDLERLMDKEAKDQLRAQMKYVPDRVTHRNQVITESEAAKGMPSITVDNVYATIEQFRADARMIFRRGLANAFSKLDRRFKSHDGFKIGSRIIINYMFDNSGHLNWNGPRDTLIDIERVFSILDGNPEGSFQSTLYQIEDERKGSYNTRQSEHENEYFRVRCFKNGNAHLWFRREDLVYKVNKVLAEHYGETIADGQQSFDDPLENRSLTPAKKFGFFPTPEAAARELFCNDRAWDRPRLDVLRQKGEPRLRILEPSAGTGNLARRCVHTIHEMDNWSGGRAENAEKYRFDNLVDCVEIQPELADRLNAEGIYNRVICADFLSLNPKDFELYDIIVGNPPFDLQRDVDHFTHALKFLKPGGSIHFIMSAGTEFRDNRKGAAFRTLVEKCKGSFRELPAGSFSEVGTYVNTVILSMTKPKDL